MNSYRILSLSGSDPALKPYEALIYSTFLRSLRYGNEWFMDIHKDNYYPAYKVVLESLLARTNAMVKLAVLTDDLDVCLGWSLSESNVLHYVYVKEDKNETFRKNGIGTSLLPKDFDTITNLTRIGRSIWKRKFPGVKFNPFR